MANIALGAGSLMSGVSNGYQMANSMSRNMEAQALANEQEEMRREEERKRQEETERQRQLAMEQQAAQMQSQQGMGMDPSSMASMGSAFGSSGSGSGGGLSAFGMGGSSAAGAGSSAGTASAGGAAGGSASGASGAGSAAAAAGPWAALAAVIAVNEKSARNGGHRRNGTDYAKDLIGGKVLEQDTNQRWSQKLGGYDDDKTGLLNDAGAGAEFSTLDFSNGLKKLTKDGTTGKILGAVKKLF